MHDNTQRISLPFHKKALPFFLLSCPSARKLRTPISVANPPTTLGRNIVKESPVTRPPVPPAKQCTSHRPTLPAPPTHKHTYPPYLLYTQETNIPKRPLNHCPPTITFIPQNLFSHSPLYLRYKEYLLTFRFYRVRKLRRQNPQAQHMETPDIG